MFAEAILTMGSEKIAIFDTTLRDGEQSPGCSMFLDEKVEMALQLERLGVDVIEAGFPIASDGDFNAGTTGRRGMSKRTDRGACAGRPRPMFAGPPRPFAAAARSRIHTFVATSDIHLEYKLKKTRDRGDRNDT